MYDLELEDARRYGFKRSRGGSGGVGPFGGGDMNRKRQVMQSMYKPQNMAIGLTMGMTAVFFFKSFCNTKNEDTEHDLRTGNKALVEAWKNPDSGQWEQPAPWSEKYQKLKPKIELVPRDIVRKAQRSQQ